MTAIKDMALEEVEAEIVFMALAGHAVLAAQEWRARRDRRSRPDGKWDNAGRFYPSATETQPCCGHIRRPSRAFPCSLWSHVHTAIHVARKFGVRRADMMRAAHLLERQEALTV